MTKYKNTYGQIVSDFTQPTKRETLEISVEQLAEAEGIIKRNGKTEQFFDTPYSIDDKYAYIANGKVLQFATRLSEFQIYDTLLIVK